mmetsp:Transcript_39709/g.45594  ORF Transcript_39709/g.45594 Transcript_39709/m.45594 type:complete len:110 (+) Transcript_39709:367-696(+)
MARKTEDGKNAIFSGIFASLSLIVESFQARVSNSLYLLSRNVEVTVDLLDSKNVVRKRKHWGLLLYMLSTCFIVYLMYFEQDICPKIASRLLSQLANMKPNDMIIKDAI